jgi:L-2,4-diaminobutyrate decarboxylase
MTRSRRDTVPRAGGVAPPPAELAPSAAELAPDGLAIVAPDGSNAEAARRLLRAAADGVLEYLSSVGAGPAMGQPVVRASSRELPSPGAPLEALLEEVFQSVVPSSVHLSHPGYLGHMDSGVTLAGIVADLVAAAINQNLLARELAPSATLLEREVVGWLLEVFGFGSGGSGTLVSGGTAGNVTALTAAREALLPGDTWREGVPVAARPAILASGEAHYSIHKAAGLLGLGTSSVVAVERDARHRMDPAALARGVGRAREEGRRPFCIVATAGTTGIGAIDPLAEIAAVAREERLWLHVDAAHGGALAFSERHRGKLAGVELADSLVVDPHKWLLAPKAVGAILFRERERRFRPDYQAPYLERPGIAEDLGRQTIQGSRRFEALKVWMSFRHLGREGLASLVDRSIETTRRFRDALLEDPRSFRLLHEPELNILVFQHTPPGRDPSDASVEAQATVERSGVGWLSLTTVGDQRALRAVTINPTADEARFRRILRVIRESERDGQVGRPARRARPASAGPRPRRPGLGSEAPARTAGATAPSGAGRSAGPRPTRG